MERKIIIYHLMELEELYRLRNSSLLKMSIFEKQNSILWTICYQPGSYLAILTIPFPFCHQNEYDIRNQHQKPSRIVFFCTEKKSFFPKPHVRGTTNKIILKKLRGGTGVV
jgi:hypothetical protein